MTTDSEFWKHPELKEGEHLFSNVIPKDMRGYSYSDSTIEILSKAGISLRTGSKAYTADTHEEITDFPCNPLFIDCNDVDKARKAIDKDVEKQIKKGKCWI